MTMKMSENSEKKFPFAGFIVCQWQNISLGKGLWAATNEFFPAGVWGLCLAFGGL